MNVAEKVTSIIQKETKVEINSPTDLLDQDLLLDSLDKTSVALEIEETYDIEYISDAVVQNWSSVQDVITTVESILKEK